MKTQTLSDATANVLQKAEKSSAEALAAGNVAEDAAWEALEALRVTITSHLHFDKATAFKKTQERREASERARAAAGKALAAGDQAEMCADELPCDLEGELAEASLAAHLKAYEAAARARSAARAAYAAASANPA
jgi:hypothetical protein